jgi:anthranilate synthase component 1
MHYRTQPLPSSLNLLELYQFKPERYPGVLVSTASSDLNGRYDILPAFPQYELRLDSDFNLHSTAPFSINTDSSFLTALEQCWQYERVELSPDDTIPFSGGWFVYLSYELAGEIEPCLNLPELPAAIPIALAMRCPLVLIHDRFADRSYLVIENEYEHLVNALHQDIDHCQSKTDAAVPEMHALVEDDDTRYLQQVARIKNYIVDGDIFQANLSRGWRLSIDASISDKDIFSQLAKSNPGYFAALFSLGEVSVLSSSPERLISVRNGIAQTRPIAGTRPRADDSIADEALATELLQHPKEQAEHVMLIDLERNDLGRLCVPGSIEVNEMMTLESYQHVHHIVSNVRGRLRDEITPADVIRAVFPGGTITGCPKVRCMEILAELEQQPRAAYTGSVGYINRDGSMDLNILIRTMMRNVGEVTLRAGGGIVADSDAQAELAETRAKARGLLTVFRAVEQKCSV